MTPASPLILVVEDDPDMLSAVAAILVREGYRVMEECTGTGALDLAREQAPDLILLDLGLPGMNGIDVAQHLAEDPRTASTPIVALTGSWLATVPNGLQDVGFVRALRKPVHSADLLAAVRAVLNEVRDAVVGNGVNGSHHNNPDSGGSMEDSPQGSAALIADLNDLLRLDHDAIQAYGVAIENLENESFRQTLRQFRSDHERHVTELGRLIQTHGGTPASSAHLTTGLFKVTVQQVGRVGGDRGILLAFELNERQARDKYWRYVEQPHPPRVQAVLRRNATEEDRHYSWVIETLRRMGIGPDSMLEQATDVLAQVQARAADLLEGAERSIGEAVETARRSTGR
jgi:uncharacterized protein (TIGR02284 family)